MHNGLYLACLVAVIAGLALLDCRYKLVLRQNPKRALIVIITSVIIFLAWDMRGIRLHIFAVGTSRALTGVQLLPGLPLEEPVFLVLLAYQTMIVWEAIRRRYAR